MDSESDREGVPFSYPSSRQQRFGSESSSSRYSTPSFFTGSIPPITNSFSDHSAPPSRATTPFLTPYYMRDNTPARSLHNYSSPSSFNEQQDYSEARAPRSPQWVPPRSPPHDRRVTHNALEEKYSQLLTDYRVLESEIKGIKYSYNLLVQSVASNSSANNTSNTHPNQARHPEHSYTAASSLPLPLSQTNYPKVRYWPIGSFKPIQDATVFREIGGKSQRGRGRRSQGVNITYPFIEDRNGLTATGGVVNGITAHARRVFEQLLKSNVAPSTWSHGTPRVQNYFREEMYKNFPDLQLCENHWKADKIATNLYSGWFKRQKAHGVKVEPTDPGNLVNDPDTADDLGDIDDIDDPQHQPAQSSPQQSSTQQSFAQSSTLQSSAQSFIQHSPAQSFTQQSPAQPASLKHHRPMSGSMDSRPRKKPYKVPGMSQHPTHTLPGGVFPNLVTTNPALTAQAAQAMAPADVRSPPATNGDVETATRNLPPARAIKPFADAPITHAPILVDAQATSLSTHHPASTTPNPMASTMGEDTEMADLPQLTSKSPCPISATESDLEPDLDEPRQQQVMPVDPSPGIAPEQSQYGAQKTLSHNTPQTDNLPPQANPAHSLVTTSIIPKLVHPLLGLGNTGQSSTQTTSRLPTKATAALSMAMRLGDTESQAILTSSHFPPQATNVVVERIRASDKPMYVPKTATSPRNLFAIDYHKKNGIASAGVFKNAWDALNRTTRNYYMEQSNLLKKKAGEAKEKAAATGGDPAPL
ncbi:hypothetical protein BD779DRAFT_1680061 [Infundibulicybe gibba]|nr:hypothetical protein BD779DRAFT_1680061 [Infundibulicybe gibba]